MSILEIVKKILTVIFGWYVGMAILNGIFDYVLYSYVIWAYGILYGSVIMTFLAGIACHLTFVFYDWSKRDWLGIELIKELRYTKTEKEGTAKKIIKGILNKSDVAAFIILSIKYDAFITTLYLRKGHNDFTGLQKRDRIIFIGSLFLSNLYWASFIFLGLEVIDSLTDIEEIFKSLGVTNEIIHFFLNSPNTVVAIIIIIFMIIETIIFLKKVKKLL